MRFLSAVPIQKCFQGPITFRIPISFFLPSAIKIDNHHFYSDFNASTGLAHAAFKA